MTAGSALRELGGVLDGMEQVAAVRHVELVEVTVEPDAGALTAEVELSVATGPADADNAASAAALRPATTVDSEGRLRLAFETVDPLVPAADGVSVEPAAVSLAGAGRLVVTLSVAVSTGRDCADDAARETTARAREAGGSHGHDDADTDTGDGRRKARAPAGADDGRADGGSAGEGSESADGDRADRGEAGGTGGQRSPSSRRDRSVPPFRDTELLAEVYAAHGTFAEMADALGMDVTAETVRRYMIDAGVHQPTSYNTGGADAADTTDDASDAGTPADDAGRDGSTDESEPPDTTDRDGSPVVLADGIGLPNDITVETLVETVKRSNTVHEVERAVGVDHDEALELLRELNLLDLVVGRLATEAERDIGRAEVVDRLREASATR